MIFFMPQLNFRKSRSVAADEYEVMKKKNCSGSRSIDKIVHEKVRL